MSDVAVTQLYVVRHGETDWNRAQRLQGTTDTRLNRTGLDQARRLARWFATRPVSCVITSPLARAQQTAMSIAQGGRYATSIDPALIELDHGPWTGLTLPHIAGVSPDAVRDGQLHTESLSASGGEPVDAAYARASRALRQLLGTSPRRSIVIVSHGVTNALLICAATGTPVTRMGEYMQGNGVVHRLCFRGRTLVSLDCRSLAAPVLHHDERRALARSANE